MIKDILKSKQIKATNQRIMILSFIIRNGHTTIKDINQNFKYIDLSTIYRIISLFDEKNLIKKAVYNHLVYYYFNEEHHHYIECIKCHKKEFLDDCPYRNIDLKGFKINKDEAIKGICKTCQEEKIGILVGSFNPPTKAHLEMATILLEQKVLDKIIYIPCDNLEKKYEVSLNDRIKMLQMIVGDNKKMIVDDFKLHDKYHNFNYHDLDKLKKKYQSNIYVIMGSDSFLNLSNWEHCEEILNSKLIIINRNHNDDVSLIKEKYSQYAKNITIIDYHNELSSSKAREMISRKDDLTMVLTKETIDYINNHQLYH